MVAARLTATDLLASARELIELLGWIRNSWRGDDGRISGALALIVAAGGDYPSTQIPGHNRDSYRSARLALNEAVSDNYTNWELDRSRTIEDVLTAFKNAEALAQQGD